MDLIKGGGVMSTDQPSDFLTGIFSGCTPPTPDIVRLWLQVTRTALGWSIAEAANESGTSMDALTTLEASGEPLNEEDDDVLATIADTYERAFRTRPSSTALADELRHYASLLRGDADFPLARFLRHRRAELGLTIDEVVRRAGGAITAEDLQAAEWNGTQGVDNYDGDLRAVAKALEVPFLAPRLLAEHGEITEADIREWVAWRDGQQTSGRRKRRAA